MSRRQHVAHRAAGVTLLEMLVVLGLVALAATLALPLLRGPPPAIALDALAREIARDLARVRAAAIGSNTARGYTVDVTARTYGADGAPVRRALPADVSVE
jgi:general secretion pathway protein H